MFIPEDEIPEYQIHMDHALQEHGDQPVITMSISKPTPEFAAFLSIQTMKSGYPTPVIPLSHEHSIKCSKQ